MNESTPRRRGDDVLFARRDGTVAVETVTSNRELAAPKSSRFIAFHRVRHGIG
jgi:hypothetical protein